MTVVQNYPAFYLSHGGGPWPYMTGPFREHFARLEASLQALPATLPAPPEAIVMITSHWLGPQFLISTAAAPGMVYDYSGFPEHTYHISYPAPGQPSLAREIGDLLAQAKIPFAYDAERGFDHGSFSLLAVLYPAAQVPVVQISIRRDFDVLAHWQLGQALCSLRLRPVLLIGSGLSYHNLRAFNGSGSLASAQFDDWLRRAVIESKGNARYQALLAWQNAPGARQSHPVEDHLIPLMVIAGAAENELASYCYHQTDFMSALTVSSFRFA